MRKNGIGFRGVTIGKGAGAGGSISLVMTSRSYHPLLTANVFLENVGSEIVELPS